MTNLTRKYRLRIEKRLRGYQNAAAQRESLRKQSTSALRLMCRRFSRSHDYAAGAAILVQQVLWERNGGGDAA